MAKNDERRGLTEIIPPPENLKFWGVVCLIILGIQGYMWVGAGVFEPVDIYEENTITLHYIDVNWVERTTIYTVSDYGSSGGHDGDFLWYDMDLYENHTIEMNMHFEGAALDMLYLICLAEYETPLSGVAGEDGWTHYLPVDDWGRMEECAKIILDYRDLSPSNDVDVGEIYIPEPFPDSNWWLVSFYRNMAGYEDSGGNWINTHVRITANITAAD